MLKTYKIIGLVYNNTDNNTPKKVIAVHFLLKVKNDTGEMSGNYTIDVPYDENVEFTNYEELTEETVLSWIDISILESRFADLQSVLMSQTQIIEIDTPPWEKSNPVIQLLLQQINPEPEETPRLNPPSFENMVANVVNKILIEKGLAT